MPKIGYKRTKEQISRWRKTMLKKRGGFSNSNRFGKKASHFKLGKVNAKGYIGVLAHHHLCKECHGYVLANRLIIEKKIGRSLLKTEIVGHLNGDKKDNRLAKKKPKIG